MAKIIYGVSGEGSGHSSRAKEISSYLQKHGHTLKLVSYDRGYANLKDHFDCFETEGLHIASEDNQVSVVKTFTDNLSRLPEGFKKLNQLRELFKSFQPDCVVTDFEPMTAYLAKHYDLPLITIDNQHRMRYMEYEVSKELDKDRLVTETVIRAMVPRPDVSLVTTFYWGKVKNNRTFLFPPILRREVADFDSAVGESILVYLTSGFDSLLDLLKKFDQEKFVVYGYDKSLVDENIEFKPFSKTGFLKDLANSKAVIATAGFTLMSEAFYLAKPYLAMPMQGQFEQQLNGVWLEMMGFGLNAPVIDEDKIGHFLYRLQEYRPRFKDHLKHYQAYLDGKEGEINYEICHKLNELLADNCGVLRDYFVRRET
jgi:uncharacterized protein (TIGR00661 family)